MSLQLPVSIEQYVQIANSGALEAVSECFALDAIVYDEGLTYEGVAAIKNWMAATKKKYGHTVTPLELAEHGGQSVLKAAQWRNFARLSIEPMASCFQPEQPKATHPQQRDTEKDPLEIRADDEIDPGPSWLFPLPPERSMRASNFCFLASFGQSYCNAIRCGSINRRPPDGAAVKDE
jgi:hypothetical protein